MKRTCFIVLLLGLKTISSGKPLKSVKVVVTIRMRPRKKNFLKAIKISESCRDCHEANQ